MNLSDLISGSGSGYVVSLDGVYDKTKFVKGEITKKQSVFQRLFWTQKTSGASARDSSTSAIYQDKMYIFGGWDGGNRLNDIWEYDITNDTWTQKTSGVTARSDSTSAIYQDKMYIFGGYSGSYLNDMWEYDITNDTWTQKTSGATARYDSTSVIYQDKMYIFGGWDGSNRLNDMWEYDITNDTRYSKNSFEVLIPVLN